MRHVEFAHALVHAGANRGDITPGLVWKPGVKRADVIRVLRELRFALACDLDSSGSVRWYARAS